MHGESDANSSRVTTNARFREALETMSPTLTIRQATSRDAERIHELRPNSVKALCKDLYSPEQIPGWFKNCTLQGYLVGIGSGEMFVVVEGEHIVGFDHAVPGEVVAVYVDLERVRGGVG